MLVIDKIHLLDEERGAVLEGIVSRMRRGHSSPERVKANPSFYGAKSIKAEDVEELLTVVATETLVKLKEQGCIEVNECDEVSPSVLGRATCDYYLKHRETKQMQFGLPECAKMMLLNKIDPIEMNSVADNENVNVHAFIRPRRLEDISIAWLVYCMCCTDEFDEIPVRHNEEILNQE